MSRFEDGYLSRREQKIYDKFQEKYNSQDFKENLLELGINPLLADVFTIQYEVGLKKIDHIAKIRRRI